MKIIERLGRDDNRQLLVDNDSLGWIISTAFHCIALVVIGLITTLPPVRELTLTLITPFAETEDELETLQEVYFSPDPADEIGANSFVGAESPSSEAMTLAEITVVPTLELQTTDYGKFEVDRTIDAATGIHIHKNLTVKGVAGTGAIGASGAVDLITQEILQSLEERKTLVVWLFDQSGSLARQRREIHARLDRIYEELGVLEAQKSDLFKKHRDKPLLSAVMAFGEEVSVRTERPTDDVAEIKQAIQDIELDESGTELAFTAISTAIDRYKKYRRGQSGKISRRNVMIVVFTDEAGDDQQKLEDTIQLSRRHATPVYVVGVPAPFGRKETMMKWVDPDSRFDQTPQRKEVTQGPESLYPERLKLLFTANQEFDNRIDSGFGPYSLTRLCYESGGIYYAVHPNRRLSRSVNWRETEELTAYLRHFFDPQVMRKYAPDYVAPAEYQRRLASNKSREALVRAAAMSWISPMDRPRLRFVKRDEARLANELTEAQKSSAKLGPKINALYEILRQGEKDRQREHTLRWQAGYDLAMGRVLAMKVRTEAYNALLAKAKRGMKFKNPKNNTWNLRPSNDLGSLGSQLAKTAQQAKKYLQHVTQEHEDTPWAFLAREDLSQPLAWKWMESYTPIAPPRNVAGGGGGNRRPRRDETALKIQKKKRRPVPKL